MRLRKDGRIVQCGKDISDTDVKIIIEIVETYTQLSYTELANTVCENLDWYSASGALKYDACVKLLDKLQSIGLLELPPKRPLKRGIRTKKPMLILPELESPIECDIRDLGSVHLMLVTEKEENRLWEAYVDRYHYLGYRKPFGISWRVIGGNLDVYCSRVRQSHYWTGIAGSAGVMKSG